MFLLIIEPAIICRLKHIGLGNDAILYTVVVVATM